MSWIAAAIQSGMGKNLARMLAGGGASLSGLAAGARLPNIRMGNISMPNMSMGNIKMPSMGSPKTPNLGDIMGQGGGGGLGGMADTAQAQAAGLVAGSTPVPVLQDLVNQEYTPEMYADEAQYSLAGELDPALVGRSEMYGIETDPRTMQAQMTALQGLTDVYSQGGMTDIDKAGLAEIQAAQQNTDRGQRDAILQQQAMRGQGGNTLAALLQGQQGSSNAANMQALNVNAQAQQRALQAMIEGGQLGGQINQQQFGQQAAQSQAQDAINRFNNQNTNAARQYNLEARQNISNQNVGGINRVRQANTDLRNQAMGQNVDLRNQANQYNVVTRPQTIFGMQSGNAQAIAAGINNAANMSNDNRWRQQAINQQDRGAAIGSFGNITQGIAGAFGGGMPGIPGMPGGGGGKAPLGGKGPTITGGFGIPNPFRRIQNTRREIECQV